MNSMNKLQQVQNCAARLVMKNRVPYHASLDNVYTNLHWLRVKYQIIHKLLLIVHNSLHDKVPNEIAALTRYSASEWTTKLCETRSNNQYGDRAFSHSAPILRYPQHVEL